MTVRMVCLFVVVSLLLTVDIIHGDLSEVKPCLPGPFHKHYPSPETKEFPECHAFAENSCCQFHIADEIHKHGASNLYEGYHWDQCGPLSERCRTFIADEECFYQCEPSLSYFEDPAYPDKGYVKGVPICASYCNAWFDACRSDKTCVVDWLNDFNYTESEYHCPSDSVCKTFEEVYKNGKGLCDSMWGTAFTFEEDETACMLMHFDQEKCNNPNACARDDVVCNEARYKGCESHASFVQPIGYLATSMISISFYFMLTLLQ